MLFKRNQVEEAIGRASARPAGEERESLEIKLKRLLETDRKLGRNQRSKDPDRANYAFFSTDGPGRGSEVLFSEYEAFALYSGLRLLEHGWPQGSAVMILRGARPTLEAKHAEILTWDASTLFDEARVVAEAQPGSLAVGTTEPVFLVVGSRMGRPIQREIDPTRMVKILENHNLVRFLRSEALSASMFELVRPAHALRSALLKTTPSKRGRAS